MTQQGNGAASVRPGLPFVEQSGFEILGEEERAVQQAMHKFAREVMRPAGIAIDKLSADEVIAQGSPYWEFMATAAASGIEFDAASDDVPPQELAKLQAIVVEEFGWGDAGLAVSLAGAAFPNMMAKRAGNQELVELTAGKIGAWVAPSRTAVRTARCSTPPSATPSPRRATRAT